MALFDSLVSEAAEQFGLGGKAKTLLSGLLAFIGDPQKGGLSGFIHRLKRAGLGAAVNSWIRQGENVPISAQQIDNIFGKTYLWDLASKADLEPSVVSSALAFMLPKVIDALTPAGVVPASLPEEVGAYIAGFVSKPAQRKIPVIAPVEETPANSGFPLKWVIALLLIGWLGLLYYILQTAPSRQEVAEQEPPSIAGETPPPPAPAETAPPPPLMTEAKLSLSHQAGKVLIAGAVPDPQIRQTILDQLKAVFGEGNLNGEILVDASTKAPPWLDKLHDVLPTFNVPGTELSFDGDTINVSGALTEAAKNAWLGQLTAIAGDRFKINPLFTIADTMPTGGPGPAKRETPAPESVAPQPIPEQTAPPAVTPPAADAAADPGLATLVALKKGFSAQELVNALNQLVIHFETGSANISADSMPILIKAAEAIKAAPAGTIIEIGGHTDNRGDPTGNRVLSGARATTVREALIAYGVDANALTAQGHGDSKPIADNATEEGRSKNRRIEFTIAGQ